MAISFLCIVSCTPAIQGEPPLLLVDVGGGETLDLGDRSSGTIIVLNQGGGTLTWTASCSGTDATTDHQWLSCSKISGTVNTTSDRIDLAVSRGNMASGEYLGEVAFSSNGGSSRVFIKMLVSTSTVSFSVEPESLEFGSLTDTLQKSLKISAVGRGMAAWSLSPTSDTPWIDVGPTSGSLEAPGQVDVVVTARPLSSSSYGPVSGFLRLVGGDEIVNIPVRADIVANCGKDADCKLSNSYCNSKTGKCIAQKELGADCIGDNECKNKNLGMDQGFCVDGICCESACDGVCFECREGGVCTQLDTGAVDVACGTSSICNPGTCTADAKCVRTAIGFPCDVDDSCSGCDGAGACSKDVLVSGYCRIDDECVERGQTRAGYPCMACNSDVNTGDWTPRPEGVACDDVDWCTNPDLCDSNGTCTTTPRIWGIDGESVLDDAVDCTIDSCDGDLMTFKHEPVAALCPPRPCKTNARCDAVAGCLYDTAPLENDGFACTVDTCDSVTGLAVHTADDNLCSDARFCTKNERCEPGNPLHDERGCVWDITVVSDGINCTDDYCDVESDSRQFIPNDTFCQVADDSYCRINKRCDPSLGCVSDPRPVDDGFSCTKDSCDEANNTLVHAPDNLFCGDSRFCTINERCSPTSASRDSRGCIFDVMAVTDLIDCTTDSCNLTTDSVVFAPDNSKCLDSDYCTINERCDSEQGCVSDKRGVSDGIACTVDSCDSAASKITHVPDDSLCLDTLACTVNERCDVARGCLSDSPAVNDGVACTVDGCSEPAGVYHNPDPSRCEQKECAEVDCDPSLTGSGCVYTPKTGRCLIDGVCRATGDRNPANQCRLCAPDESQTSWSVVATGTSCDDGQVCTWGDKCAGGVCSGTPHTDGCNDGLGCTVDTCNPDGTCGHGISDGWCVIQDVGCVASGTLTESTCMTCDPLRSKISWSTAREALACNDKDACTSGDRCSVGACLGTGVSCDDGLLCTTDGCDHSSGCFNNLQDGYCLINGICHTEGQLNPASVCQGCVTSQDDTGWSPTREGQICDDSAACTHTDVCVAGACSGTPYVCEDHVSCTDNICDGVGGCEYPVSASRCLIDGRCYLEGELEPANKCRKCRSNLSKTLWTADNTNSCNDGQSCTKNDHCQDGTCLGTLYSCDDSLECTLDTCLGDGTCTNTLSNGYCLIDGACYADGEQNPLNDCEICHTDTSVIGWVAYDSVVSPTKYCDDGNDLTVGEYCAWGQCIGAGRIPDLNIDFCSGSATSSRHGDDRISCPIPGQIYYGQDGNYSRHPLSIIPHPSISGVEVDTVSGLMMIADRDISVNFDEAQAYCDTLTTGGLSWRLPTMFEAVSLIVQLAAYEEITWTNKDWTWFDFWSSEHSAVSASETWVVSTDHGEYQNHAIGRRVVNSLRPRLLCVSGGFERQPSFELSSTSTTVIDGARNLEWETGTSTSAMSWSAALSYCENRTYDGKSDWRLPSVKELVTLVDYSTHSPAIHAPELFSTKSAVYMSSSTCQVYFYYMGYHNYNYVAVVDFSDGAVEHQLKNANAYVRCVRSVCPPEGLCPQP